MGKGTGKRWGRRAMGGGEGRESKGREGRGKGNGTEGVGGTGDDMGLNGEGRKGGRGWNGRGGVTAPKLQYLAPPLFTGVFHAIANTSHVAEI